MCDHHDNLLHLWSLSFWFIPFFDFDHYISFPSLPPSFFEDIRAFAADYAEAPKIAEHAEIEGFEYWF